MVRRRATALFSIAITLAPTAARAAAAWLKWRVPLGSETGARLAVDEASGRSVVVTGAAARIVDREGRVRATQRLPTALGGRVEAAAIGPRGALVALEHGALVVGDAGGGGLLPFADAAATGAAALPSGDFLLCLASARGASVIGLGPDAARRFTVTIADEPRLRCDTAGVARGVLYAAGEHAVIAIGADGKRGPRWPLPAAGERAPIARADGSGCLAQTAAGLVALDRRGVAWTQPAVEDGAALAGDLLVGRAGRALLALDPLDGHERSRASLEPPTAEVARGPLDDEAPAIAADRTVAAAAGPTLVLLDGDGRERFRLGLPGARAARPLGARDLLVLQPHAFERWALPPEPFADADAAAATIGGDPALSLEARVMAWGRASKRLRGAPPAARDVEQLRARLVGAWRDPARRPAVLETVAGLGAFAGPIALALLESGGAPPEPRRMAPLLAGNGDGARRRIEAALDRPETAPVAAHALALLAAASRAPAAYRASLLRALAGPLPRLACDDRPDEHELLEALVAACAKVGRAAADEAAAALRRDRVEPCRARAIRRALARWLPADETLARIRRGYLATGSLPADDVEALVALGAPAATAIAELLRHEGKGETVRALADALVEAVRAGAPDDALVAILAGRRALPPDARATVVRAIDPLLSGSPERRLVPAIAAGLRQADVAPDPLRALLRLARRLAAPDLEPALLERLRAPATDEGVVREALRALVAVDAPAAAREGLAIALDDKRPVALRAFALRAVSRGATPEMRRALAPLGDGEGPLVAAAHRALLPYVGLRIDEGLRVIRVEPASPAARAGLRVGDRLLAAAGRRFARSPEYEAWVGSLRLGDRARLTIERDGAERELPIAVGGSIDLDGDLLADD